MIPAPEDIIQAVFDGVSKAVRIIGLNVSVVPGVPEHHNGTVGTSAATVTFSETSKSVLFRNTHATNDLLISFDGGSTFFTVPPGETMSIDGAAASVDVKGSAAGTTFEGLVVV